MLHIKDYNKTTIINNDIEEIIIDQLKHPLDNLPPSINKITVKKSINIYKRQNRIPYGCYLIIENITINDIDVFNNMKEEDYPDIAVLNLGDNKITIIPEQISLLYNLRELYLFDNQITIIPVSISSLINLQILNLSSNNITIIPEYISSLINLQELYLYNNQITIIPESIRDKQYLKL